MPFHQGDIVLHDYGEPIGHEPAKARPVIVVSNDFFNLSSSMVLLCPITSAVNPFPLHIQLPEGLKVRGGVVTEQVRAYDLEARGARIIDHIDPSSDAMRAILQCVRSFF